MAWYEGHPAYDPTPDYDPILEKLKKTPELTTPQFKEDSHLPTDPNDSDTGFNMIVDEQDRGDFSDLLPKNDEGSKDKDRPWRCLLNPFDPDCYVDSENQLFHPDNPDTPTFQPFPENPIKSWENPFKDWGNPFEGWGNPFKDWELPNPLEPLQNAFSGFTKWLNQYKWLVLGVIAVFVAIITLGLSPKSVQYRGSKK